VIGIIVATLRLLPDGVRRFLWVRAERWHGLVGVAARYCIAKTLCRNCGDNVMIGPDVEIRGWRDLSLGENVSIHRACYIDANGGITIGDDVSIAHATSFVSFEHTWDDSSVPIKDNPSRFAPIRVDDDVWIGCGCRILAGVHIGSRSIVAAGAVVVRDIPSGHVVGGVPARVIKQIQPAAATSETT
jgi:acetyltransferase-like isoleucine patch superfamily enzyme